MKIIEPSVEYWKQEDEVSHVCRCARVCYGKESGDDEKLYNHLLNARHYSMFRHVTHYYIVHNVNDTPVKTIITANANKIGFDYHFTGIRAVIVTNGNWNIDNPRTSDVLREYEVTAEEFANDFVGVNMMRFTFCCTTQISTSRELNRVSPNNIAEQSTRYVYENDAICRPHWMPKKIAKEVNKNLYPCNFEASDVENRKTLQYLNICANSFNTYKFLINHLNMHRQDARGVLPLDTATKVVYTYNIDEWKHIIDLRYYGTTGKPHPNAEIIAGMIKDKLSELNYIV